jgi:hypothetical protein
MSIRCDITLRWGATPDQLQALGGALWRWCVGTRGDTSIYQYLDNQVLADLRDGRHPVAAQTPRQAESGVRFSIRDEASRDRQATLTSLRRQIPAAGVEDIVVDGKSWNLPD